MSPTTYFCLWFTDQHQEQTVADLAYPNSNDVHLHHPVRRSENSTVVTSYVLQRGVYDSGTYHKSSDIDEQREWGENLQANQRQIISDCRRGCVERNIAFHHLGQMYPLVLFLDGVAVWLLITPGDKGVVKRENRQATRRVPGLHRRHDVVGTRRSSRSLHCYLPFLAIFPPPFFS
jgi:hypothetical protein